MADKAVEPTDTTVLNPDPKGPDVTGPVEEWSNDDDVDTIAFKAAHAELNGTDDDEGGEDPAASEPGQDKAEQNESKPEDGQKDDAVKAEAAGTSNAEAAPEGDMPTVPLVRFNEVNGKFRETQEANTTLQQQVAYLTGKLEAGAPATGPAADQSPTVIEDPIAAERQKIVDLAKQFDDGEISYSDLKTAEMEAEARIDGHRTANQGAQPGAASDNMVLDMHAEDLASKHPFADHFTDPQWDLIETEARTVLAEEIGRPLTGAGRDIMALQTRMAELTDKYGPVFTGKTLADITKVEQPAAETQQLGPKTATAQQRQEKLDDAQRHPVDTSGLGGGATQGEMTAQEFVQLSDEEIMALPASVRDRFSNSS